MVDLFVFLPCPYWLGWSLLTLSQNLPQPLEQHTAVLLTAESIRLFAGRELKESWLFFGSRSVGLTAFFGPAACPSSSASRDPGAGWGCGAGRHGCSCRCRDGDGWPEPCPEDHCGESLLPCHSRCSAPGKVLHYNYLKVVLEEGAAATGVLL